MSRTMENKIGRLVSGIGQNAKDVLEKTKNLAVQVADQNDDGKFDMEDVSVMASSFGDAVKKGAHSLKETVDEKSKQMEIKTLKPFFMEDLNGFSMPRFIRVVERDKKHAESEICKGSIGFWADFNDNRLLNIFRDAMEVYGLSFYPNSEGEFYYVDPINKDNYIALDEYFNYLKQVRISELQKIAQDLGAKYFRVTYKEEKSSFTEKKAGGKIGVKSNISAEIEQNCNEKNYSKIEIAAEMRCPGHGPVEPQLRYMKYDPTISNLVEMRMNAQGALSHQTLTLKLSNSSGLKESEAAKIDAILKRLKCAGNLTVLSETKNEARRYLEYEIGF